MGFYYAPPRTVEDPDGSRDDQDIVLFAGEALGAVKASLGVGLTKLWA